MSYNLCIQCTHICTTVPTTPATNHPNLTLATAASRSQTLTVTL